LVENRRGCDFSQPLLGRSESLLHNPQAAVFEGLEAAVPHCPERVHDPFLLHRLSCQRVGFQRFSCSDSAGWLAIKAFFTATRLLINDFFWTDILVTFLRYALSMS
jgi:hypothetical protein